MDGTEVDPGTGNPGANKVVGLILPDATKSIHAGTFSFDIHRYEAAFKDFGAFESVSGAGVEMVGGCAFCQRTSLVSVDLPAATAIGDGAFDECYSLASVSLPVTTSIGGAAFYECESLALVDLPVATSIGFYAFEDCESLATVSLPAVTSIGYWAFWGCTSLETVSLPATPPSIGSDIFKRDYTLTYTMQN